MISLPARPIACFCGFEFDFVWQNGIVFLRDRGGSQVFPGWVLVGMVSFSLIFNGFYGLRWFPLILVTPSVALALI